MSEERAERGDDADFRPSSWRFVNHGRSGEYRSLVVMPFVIAERPQGGQLGEEVCWIFYAGGIGEVRNLVSDCGGLPRNVVVRPVSEPDLIVIDPGLNADLVGPFSLKRAPDGVMVGFYDEFLVDLEEDRRRR